MNKSIQYLVPLLKNVLRLPENRKIFMRNIVYWLSSKD